MKKMVRFVWIAVLVGALAGGGYWAYRFFLTMRAANAPATVTSQVVTVRRGSLSATVNVVGQLEAAQRAELSFSRMSGATQLASLAVKPGHRVTAGQVLATIDPAPYQQAVDQARSEVRAAEKALADLTAPPTALQIAQADLAIARAEVQLQQAKNALAELLEPDIPALEAAVASAQSALTKAQADLLSRQQDTAAKDTLARLITAEATPTALYNRLAAETYSDAYYQDRLEMAYNRMMDAQDARVTNELQAQINLLQAQMTVRKSERALAEAEAALAAARAGAGSTAASALALAQARLAVQEAEVARQAAEAERAQLTAGATEAALASAQAELVRKRLALAEAEAALAGTQLAAPFAGTVLQVGAAVGDVIAANTVVVTLADLQTLRVVAAIDELTIRRVAAGQGAVVTFDAFPGQRFRGEVLAVPLQGELQGGVMVYEAPIGVTGVEGLSLLVGMTANVQITAAQAADALLVPAIAVQRSGGVYRALVVNAAAPELPPIAVPVEVGLSDGVQVQVLSGLQEGDRVVVEVETGSPAGALGGGTTQNPLATIWRQFSRPMGR